MTPTRSRFKSIR